MVAVDAKLRQVQPVEVLFDTSAGRHRHPVRVNSF